MTTFPSFRAAVMVVTIVVIAVSLFVLETTGISSLSANMIVPNLRTVPSVPDPSDLDSLQTDDAEPETKSHLNSFSSTGTAEALPFPPRRLVGVKDSEELRAALARLAEFDEEAERTAWELRLESPLIELSSPLTIPSNRDVRIVSASSFSSSPSSTQKKSTASSGLSDVGLVGAALVARENTGLFRVGDGASLELANVELHGGTAQDGGAISNLGGHVYLSGCSLSNHTAWGRGGAIFSRGGSLLLENTTLENCRADMAGGAVFIAGVEEEEEGGGDLQPLTASSVAASIVALLGDWMQGQPSSAQVASADALSRRRRLLSRTSVSFSRVSFQDNTAPSGSDFMLEELGDTFPSLASSSPTVPLSSSPHSSSSLSSWLWPLLFKATSSPKQKSVKVASEQGEGKGEEKRGGSSSEQMEALVALVIWSMSFLWIVATAMVVASAVGALIFAAAAALLKTTKSSTSTHRSSSSSSSSGGLLGGPLSPLPPKKHQQRRRSVVARAVRWLLFGSRGSSTENDDELGESPTNASATSLSTTTIGRSLDSRNNHVPPPPPPAPPSLTMAKRWEQFRSLLQQEKRALERGTAGPPTTTPPLHRLAAEVDGVDPEAPPTPTIVIDKSRAREVLSPARNRANDDDDQDDGEEEEEENDDDVESVGLLRASEKKKKENKEVTTTPPRDCQDSDHDLDDDDNEAGEGSEGSGCGGGGRSRTLLPELVVPLSALEIEALQAKGAHSTVYRAAVAPLAGEVGGRFGTRALSNATTRRTVALKRIQLPPLQQQHSHHDDNDSEELVAGWRREASIMASLPRHHALVRLLGVVCDDTPVIVASSSSSSSSSSETEMRQGLGGGGRASEPFGVGLVLEFMPLGSLRDALTAGLLLPWTLAAPQEEAAATGGGGGAGAEALAGMMTHGVADAPTQVLMHRSDSTTHILPAPLPRHPDPVIALSAAGHQIALDVASAVAHLHLHGVAHRDLKSSNVLLDERGRAKVADFGDATSATTTACEGRRCRDSYPRHPFTHQQQGLVEARADFLPPLPPPQPAAASPPCFGGSVVGGSGGLDGEEGDGSSSGGSGHMRGTLLYASPELLKGEAHNGRSADVWALGMVLVEVATGQTLLQLWQHEQRVRQAQREQSRRSSRHPSSSSSSPFLRPAFSAPSKVPCIVLPSAASGAPPHPTAAAVPNTLGGRSLPPVPGLLQACGWRPDVRKRSAGGACLPVPRDSPQRFGPKEAAAAAAGGLVRSSVLESCWAAAPRDRPSAAAILQHLEDHSLRPSPSSDTDQACLVGLSSPTPVACQQDQDQEEGGEVAAKAGVDALLLPDPSPGDLQNGANNDDLHRQTSPQLVTVQHDDLHRGPAPSPTNLSRESDRSFSASACAGGSSSSSPLSKPPIPQGTATTGFSPPPEAAAVVTLQPRPGSIGSASPLTSFHGSGSGGGGCGGGGAIQDVREESDRDCDDPPYADTAVLLPHTSSSSPSGRRMASSSLAEAVERPAVGSPEPVSSFGGERTGANGHSRTVAESEDAEPAVSDRFLEAWGAWL